MVCLRLNKTEFSVLLQPLRDVNTEMLFAPITAVAVCVAVARRHISGEVHVRLH